MIAVELADEACAATITAPDSFLSSRRSLPEARRRRRQHVATRPLLAAEQAIELCTRRRIQAALERQVLVAALSELSRDVCVHGIHLADQHVTRETGHRDFPHGRTNRAVRRDHGGASRLQAGIRDQTTQIGRASCRERV